MPSSLGAGAGAGVGADCPRRQNYIRHFESEVFVVGSHMSKFDSNFAIVRSLSVTAYQSDR